MDTQTKNVTVIHTPEQAQYGRSPGGFQRARDEWWSHMGDNDAQQEASNSGYGYAANQTGANAEQGWEDTKLGRRAGINGDQQGAIGLAGSMARGDPNSVAQQQLRAGVAGARAQQGALAAGARGSAALAVGNANAAANQAAIGQQGNAQSRILQANEMAAGRGLYGGLAGQAQDQDQFRLGQNTQLQQQNSQLRDSYALGMGNAAVGIGGSMVGQGNVDQAYYQGGMGVVDAQTEADQARQRWLAAAQKQKVAANMEDQ